MGNDESIEVRVARLDERTATMHAELVAVRIMVEGNFVTKREFENRVTLIEKLVFGGVSCTLLLVLGGLIGLVLKK